MERKKIVVLTGAGMSAESGISTFRDSGGLWEGHDVMSVASPQGWNENKEMVLKFYNLRRQQLKTVIPNDGHKIIAQMERYFNTTIITQNVDNLHEKAGSTKVIHLHGELTKVCSEHNISLVYDWHDDVRIGDKAEDGAQLRPFIVWFGEMVPMLEVAAEEVATADILIIVGTSMQVYPAAGLYMYSRDHCPIYYVDPKPAFIDAYNSAGIKVIQKGAVEGLKIVYEDILKNVS